MSWKAEVQVAGDAKWYDNAIRFARKDEALDYVLDLKYRWTSVVNTRAVEVPDEPPLHHWYGGKAVPL